MTAGLLSKDFWAGLLFVGLGLFGLWLASDLEVGTSDAMATGYFPRMICILMAAVGAVVSAIALVTPGERVPAWHWRPLILVTLATAAFALLFKPLGLVATILLTVLLAGFAGRAQRLLPMLLLAGLLIVATTGLFVFALRMPIPLWPSVL